MSTTRLSSRGQVALPKNVREKYHWTSGQEFEIVETDECFVNRQCLDGMSRTTLCTGESISSEISVVAPLESNGATERIRPFDSGRP